MSKKIFLFFAVLLTFFFQIGCSKLKTASCKGETAASVTAADISAPPGGLQAYFVGTYTPTKYISVSANNATMHIFGTSTVSNWMMINTHEMIKNMVNSISSTGTRSVFDGFQAFVITDSDPAIPGALAGQRNTGIKTFMVINEVLVCATAVDTIRPANPPEYRAWDTPIHEFGHSIQQAAGLESFMEGLESKYNSNYDSSLKEEYFPFAIQNWFDHRLSGTCGIDSLPSYEKAVFTTLLNSSEVWRATCAGRP